jgi:hypothetical protein
LHMRFAFQTLAGFVVAFALALPSCAKPPKQAEVPDVTKDTGADMSGGEDARNGGEVAADSNTSAEDMHAKCCGLCKDALAKDRSGAAPSTIPCADFTDSLTPWCLEHFRTKPMMASECK